MIKLCKARWLHLPYWLDVTAGYGHFRELRYVDAHIGLLFNLGALWVGAHWSRHNRRLCINLLPCLTLWVTLPGGNEP